MTQAVSIQNVGKRYGSLLALDGVEFDIGQGEFFGLLGPNGAGKSTLINTMAGLVRATSGSISVMGFDVVRQYRKSRNAIGVVPQELVYDPFFTVMEVLKLQSGYFACTKRNRQWLDELLQVLDLSDKADTNLHDLSGGMKRRVLIAQALVHRPEVLVLDEPTAGVDVELRQVLWEFTRRLHDQGHTIVLTTHYLEEAEALCERIAILDHGRLKVLDSKDNLLARHPYRFLVLTLEHMPDQLPSSVEALVVERSDREITLRMHKVDDQIAAVLDTFHSAGISLLELKTCDPGLEDVFLELTSRGRANP